MGFVLEPKEKHNEKRLERKEKHHGKRLERKEKHHGKRLCWLPAFPLFLTMCAKSVFVRLVKKWDILRERKRWVKKNSCIF